MSWRVVVTAIGDGLVLVLFAVIGRASHHHTLTDPLDIAGTAAPFLAGWVGSSLATGAYSPGAFVKYRGLYYVGRSWGIAAIIALAIRSVAERRIVPLSFVVVAFSFNLLLLLLWRAAGMIIAGRISHLPEPEKQA